MSRVQEEKTRRKQNENKGQVPPSSAPLRVVGAPVRELTLEYGERSKLTSVSLCILPGLDHLMPRLCLLGVKIKEYTTSALCGVNNPI